MSQGAWAERSVADHGSARLTTFFLALTVFAGGFVFIEPAPYEVVFALLCCALLIDGARVPGILALPMGLLSLWAVGGLLSIAASGGGGEEATYLAVSAYLALTTIVFAALGADRPEQTAATIRRAYLAAAAVTALAGIAGYFHLLPGSDQFVLYNRARGVFKDPNVFAPFLILPALLMVQDVLSGSRRKLLGSGAMLAVLLVAILLSFSRAAWGNLIFSCALMAGLLFVTSHSNRLRIWIVGGGLFGLCMAGALIAALLAVPAVSDIFMDRADIAQDYDAGVTGRFGTQLRSLPDLLEAPLGFGPGGFAARYVQDPHNVYLNGFASYGWLGGLSYLMFVAATLVVGFRCALIRAPWQGFLIALFATYTGVALEGMVIDTDHWRHYFLIAGLVWGFSAASIDHRANATYLRATM